MMVPAASLEQLEAAVTQFHADARGKFELFLVRQQYIPGLLVAAAAGDAGAVETLLAVDDFVKRSAAERTLCLTCPRLLERRLGVVVMVRALRESVREAMFFGYCRGCAGGRSDTALGKRTIAKLRATIWSDLHEIVIAGAGHA
jgi:hypothetical protein